jgi:hypothetical protein
MSAKKKNSHEEPFLFGASALDFCNPYSPFVSSLVLFRLLFSVTLDAVEACGKRSWFLFDHQSFLELFFLSFFLSCWRKGFSECSVLNSMSS